MQGLHAEYERLRREGEGGSKASASAGSSDLMKLKACLQTAQKQMQDLKVCPTFALHVVMQVNLTEKHDHGVESAAYGGPGASTAGCQSTKDSGVQRQGVGEPDQGKKLQILLLSMQPACK